MIIDTLNNLEKYISVNPLFAVVADFIKENDLSALEPGKHVIKGDEVFVNIQVAKGKTVEEAVLPLCFSKPYCGYSSASRSIK